MIYCLLTKNNVVKQFSNEMFSGTPDRSVVTLTFYIKIYIWKNTKNSEGDSFEEYKSN